MKKQILIPLLILIFLFVGTTAVILYGRGYRFGFEKGRPDFLGTGLLVATSIPDGAQVFINDHLSTATDNTINLTPGDYTIKIFQEGYFPWEKKIKVQEEVVSKADALLFPTAPKLESVTAIGADNPTIDPSQTRIAYTVASQSARKNGIYILDMTSRPILTLQSASTQIVDDTIDIFSQAQIVWSPDGKQLIATIQDAQGANATTYLLDSNTINEAPQDITATLDSVLALWETERKEKDAARLATLKAKLRTFIPQHFTILAWSPDETKILYQASASATIPTIIIPPLLGANPTPEERDIKKGTIYVYDIKEDTNFKIDLEGLKIPQAINDLTQLHLPVQWFPDSEHLVYVHDKKIDIMEYDGLNQTTIYAGPFIDNYVFPWPNGSKMLILTALGNPSISPNLYTISLK